MKKLTDIIKENTGTNIYSYKVKLDISGLVHAENEGAAGEEVDKEMDVIMGAISETGIGVSSDTYNIESIELSLGTDHSESIDNNKILESLDADREGELHIFAQQIAEQLLSREELEFLIKRISIEFKQTEEPASHQRKYNVGTEINQDLSDILNAAMTNYIDYVAKIKEFNSKYDLNLLPLHKMHLGQSNNFKWEDGEELSPQEIQLRWDAMLDPEDEDDEDPNAQPNPGNFPEGGEPRSNY